ncbi:oxidoreductase [Paenibacillus harenae]|jgi:NAD(P)-dependent dehydrogenase (short-subunit alcohol dehydrogenase family)|uniref:oxidoreductase n=1 Tax=Paenibacillus harenae TaxID=306543 RepID=UPI002791F0B9|nr:oxidoreductase [Paenibacillus harenae]MDQ0057897.1 NAD(P)-dependent dehydrogenase (short-subunit alcohol dehydrogenase family) [Paenibacillus harenae]
MNNIWTKDNIPDLSGKVAVVTGANSGLGFETAAALAERRAKVILAVRNMDKGEAALNKIKSVYASADVNLMKLDLSDLNSVRTFAADFLKKHESLSILINNAGIMIPAFQLTKDGFESQFGGNHLGHFALTGLLLPRLISTPKSRVVTLSSIAAHNASINFDNLDGSKGYDRFKLYGQSKLANLLFAKELQNKFSSHHIDSMSVACHPGFSNTNLSSFGSGKRANIFIRMLASVATQPAHMGALPTLFSATSPTIKGGEYIGPDGKGGRKGYPKNDEIIERLYDSNLSSKLWRASETLTGIYYQFEK